MMILVCLIIFVAFFIFASVVGYSVGFFIIPFIEGIWKRIPSPNLGRGPKPWGPYILTAEARERARSRGQK